MLCLPATHHRGSPSTEAVGRLLLLVPHLPDPGWIHEAARSGALPWAKELLEHKPAQQPQQLQAPKAQPTPHQLLFTAATWLAKVRKYGRGAAPAGERPTQCLVNAAKQSMWALCELALAQPGLADWQHKAGFIVLPTWLFAAERAVTMALAVTTLQHHTVLPRSMALLHMAGEGLEGLYGWLLRTGCDRLTREQLDGQVLALARAVVQILHHPRELQRWCRNHDISLASGSAVGSRLIGGLLVLVAVAALNQPSNANCPTELEDALIQACLAVNQAPALGALLPAELRNNVVFRSVADARRCGRLLPDWRERLGQALSRMGDPLVRLRRRWGAGRLHICIACTCVQCMCDNYTVAWVEHVSDKLLGSARSSSAAPNKGLCMAVAHCYLHDAAAVPCVACTTGQSAAVTRSPWLQFLCVFTVARALCSLSFLCSLT